MTAADIVPCSVDVSGRRPRPILIGLLVVCVCEVARGGGEQCEVATSVSTRVCKV